MRDRPVGSRRPDRHGGDPGFGDRRVGASGVEVVADDVFEEHPPRNRAVQDLGQGELGLPDRDVVAVAGLAVGRAERVRQPGEPLAQQGVDLFGSEPVADRLQPGQVGRVGDGGEPDPRVGDLSRLEGTCCPGPSAEHWFGIDQQGRDEFSRIVYGARFSLLIGVVSVTVGLSIGLIFGAIAGYFGGVVDSLIMRITDIMLAIPGLVLSQIAPFGSYAAVFWLTSGAFMLVALTFAIRNRRNSKGK